MDLVVDNRLSVLAYAAAFARLQEYYGCFGDKMEKYRPIFVALSNSLGVPLDQEGQFAYVQADFKNSMTLYPLYSSLYEIYCFLADTSNAEIGTPGYAIDFAELLVEIWTCCERTGCLWMFLAQANLGMVWIIRLQYGAQQPLAIMRPDEV